MTTYTLRPAMGILSKDSVITSPYVRQNSLSKPSNYTPHSGLDVSGVIKLHPRIDFVNYDYHCVLIDRLYKTEKRVAIYHSQVQKRMVVPVIDVEAKKRGQWTGLHLHIEGHGLYPNAYHFYDMTTRELPEETFQWLWLFDAIGLPRQYLRHVPSMTTMQRYVKFCMDYEGAYTIDKGNTPRIFGFLVKVWKANYIINNVFTFCKLLYTNGYLTAAYRSTENFIDALDYAFQYGAGNVPTKAMILKQRLNYPDRVKRRDYVVKHI